MIRRPASADFRGIAAIALALLVFAAHAETITGRVVSVADGDTLTVLDASNTQHKIRLAGIDAPERKQPFGTVSRQHLAQLAFGKAVLVVHNKKDRYGRQVGKVAVDGVDVGLEQIKAGLAWHYKAYEREQPTEDRAAYAGAELVARSARLGLWSEASAVPPWEWRHRMK
jgi:endonuclease YncB( thermonuclease family)